MSAMAFFIFVPGCIISFYYSYVYGGVRTSEAMACDVIIRFKSVHYSADNKVGRTVIVCYDVARFTRMISCDLLRHMMYGRIYVSGMFTTQPASITTESNIRKNKLLR